MKTTNYFLKTGFICLISLLSVKLFAQATDITTGLISHWAFDETNGTISVNSVDVNFNATLSSSVPGALTWLPEGGSVKGAALLNGSGGFRTPFYNVQANLVTLSFWVKADFTKNGGWRGLVYDRGDGNKGISIENGKIMSGKWTSVGGGGEYPTTLTIPDNTWTFISLTVNATLMQVKMRPLGAATYSTWSQSGTFSGTQLKQFAIGDDFWGSNLIGALDDVRLYNRILTSDDISALFALGNSQLLANAGDDMVTYLPYNKITLKGIDSPKAEIVERKWELLQGIATLGVTTDSILQVSNLTKGKHLFRYTVKNSQGKTYSDSVTVTAIFVDESLPRITDPPRVKIIQTTNGSTIGTFDGQRLRGVPMAYATSDVNNPFDTKIFNPNFYKTARNMGFNAVRCFVENADVYDSSKVEASLAILDTIVNLTSKYGLQLMLNTGNIGYFRNPGAVELKRLIEYNKILNGILTTRYKNRTHVIFEQQNEPFYNSAGSYPTIVQDIADCYTLMRSVAPDSHIALFTFMISCGYSMLDMAKALDTKVTIDWTKTSVAYHGYGPPCLNTDRILELMAAYPVVETEFWPEKNLGEGGFATEYEMEGLESAEISWFTWWLHTGQTDLSIYEPILADIKAAGKMWNFTPINLQEPVVKLGNDTTIFLPLNSVTLNGIITDPNGSIVKYNWVMVKSTGQADFTQNNATAELKNMTKGSYYLRLFAWDDEDNYTYDDITVVVGNLQYIPGKIEAEDYTAAFGVDGSNYVGWINIGDWTEYQVEVAEAGLYSIEVRAAADATFGGTGYFLFDGVPASSVFVAAPTGGWVNYQPVYCSAYLTVGRHTLRYEPIVANGYNLDYYVFTKTNATIQITSDLILTLPEDSTKLTVTATDPSGIKSYNWEIIQSPKGYVYTGVKNTNTLAVNKLIIGEYIFQAIVLTNDNLFLSKDVKVKVLACADSPAVNTGPDIKISLPQDSLSITAVADAATGIASYSWKQTSGVASTLTNTNTNILKVNGLKTGIYRYSVTVTSKAGCITTKAVKVSVFPYTGTGDLNSSDVTVNIYPNPASHTLTIERTNWTDEKTIVKLTDARGKILKQSEWQGDKMEWQVEQYGKGLFIISIYGSNKIVHRKLMIE